MKPRSQPALLIVDGGLAGLCAAWSAGVCGGSPAHSSSIAYAPPRGPGAARRAQLLRGYPTLCDLVGAAEMTDVREPAPPSAENGDDAAQDRERARNGAEQSMLLIAACREAMQLGLSRVVWPVHFGGEGVIRTGGSGGAAKTGVGQARSGWGSLDEIADACDRSMLAAQLAGVDAGRGSMGVTIELPYVDFTDAQLIELALDMGVPLASAWWCETEGTGAGGAAAGGCGTCAPCQRWRRALAAVSPGAAIVTLVNQKPERVG